MALSQTELLYLGVAEEEEEGELVELSSLS
jgi:hypothetical protein